MKRSNFKATLNDFSFEIVTNLSEDELLEEIENASFEKISLGFPNISKTIDRFGSKVLSFEKNGMPINTEVIVEINEIEKEVFSKYSIRYRHAGIYEEEFSCEILNTIKETEKYLKNHHEINDENLCERFLKQTSLGKYCDTDKVFKELGDDILGTHDEGDFESYLFRLPRFFKYGFMALIAVNPYLGGADYKIEFFKDHGDVLLKDPAFFEN